MHDCNAALMACNTSGMKVDMVDGSSLKNKDNAPNELPLARNRNVTSNFTPALIAFRMNVSFFFLNPFFNHL